MGHRFTVRLTLTTQCKLGLKQNRKRLKRMSPLLPPSDQLSLFKPYTLYFLYLFLFYCEINIFPSQVSGISLIGETHKEVVRILKELPIRVYMTCCRPAPHLQTDIDAVQPESEAFSAAHKLKVLHLHYLQQMMHSGRAGNSFHFRDVQ